MNIYLTMSLFDMQDILFDNLPNEPVITSKASNSRPTVTILDKSNLNNSCLYDKKELNYTLLKKRQNVQDFSETANCTIS